ncbi:VOC family protein [Candidatus Uhrbacteria bacterium]|nr:VOC family protein [Candidatus Uhrbacteria bacterium]
MPIARFDHVYLSVEDMNRAVAFYSELLGVTPCHREGASWADFGCTMGPYLGLIGRDALSGDRVTGDGAVPVFRTDDVDAASAELVRLGATIERPPTDAPTSGYRYRYFWCRDTEGNRLEIAEYDRKSQI